MVKIREAIDECMCIIGDNVENAGFEAVVLAQSILGKDRLWLKIHGEDEMSEDIYQSLRDFAVRRASGEPSAYITGHREFMSLDFCVNNSVLIPRPDTEILVEKVIGESEGKKLRILDMCTGSGAIACSLAYYLPNCEVTGVDISDKALEIAGLNAERLKVNKRVSLFACDVLSATDFGGMYDIVVSNPPYIESAVIDTLSHEVKDFEPLIALDGGASGLEFYKAIIKSIHCCLKKGGMAYFEIGFNQAEAVVNIMNGKFCNIHVSDDYAGNNRVICGQLI